MLSDIIIIAIIVLFVVIGVRRGIARTILGIIGLFVTYAAANIMSEWLSQLIYNSFLEETVIENINYYMSSYGLSYLIDNSLSVLPEWISWLVSLFGGDSETVSRNILQTDDFTSSNASRVISGTIETMTVSAIKIILMIILFIVIYILVKKLVRLVSKVFKAPVLKQINCFFGGVLGAVNGVLCVWIAVNLVCLITQITANDITSNELINGSLFRLFSNIA